MGTSKKYDYKKINFAISPEMDQCVRMYAHSQNIPISQVLRSIIRSWIDSTCLTVEILMDEIVSKAVHEWDKQRFLNKDVVLDEFRGTWREDLMKKLPSTSCDDIIEEFNHRIDLVPGEPIQSV
jgi:hypothetical protein